MKIGLFTDSYFPRKDGNSYTIRSWKRRLEERGHEVHLYYPRSPHEPGENEHPQNSIHNPYYHGHYWPVPDFSRVGVDLDVVHCHTPWLVSFKGLLHARLNGVPAVYTYHTPLQDYVEGFTGSKAVAAVLGRILGFFDRVWTTRFDTVTCSTDAVPHDLQYEKLPVGVDEQFFRPTDPTMFQDLEPPVVGYSGRMSEEKNLEKVLELAEITEGSFVLVGEGRHRDELERKAPENVEFRDFLPRDQLPAFHSSIDVFVTASTADTFSLTTMESNLCGTPVLAPDVPPFDETIREENGERYEYGDLEDMHRKLEKVLGSEYSCREAASRYSLSTTVDRLEEIYGRET